MMSNFLKKTAAGVVLTYAAAALVWIGIAFLGFAIAAALEPSIGLAGAAATAGGVLVIGPLLWIIVTLSSANARARKAKEESANDRNAVLNVLMTLAKDKPLMAVAGASLVGLAEALLKRKGKG